VSSRRPELEETLKTNLYSAACVALLIAGCRKKPVVEERPVIVDERPPCDREARGLRDWLGVLLEEGDVGAETIPDPADEHHYLDRPLPRVTLAPTDERPSPPPSVAMITLDHGKIAHDDLVEDIQNVEAPGKVVKLATASVLSPTFGGGGAGGSWLNHPILLYVGEREPWSDVVAAVEALRKAGFTTVYFPLAATSRAAPPSLESPVAKRILAIETDAKTMPWRRDVAAASEMRRANSNCPGVAAAFEKQADNSTAMDAQRKDFVAHAADAFLGCSCHGDVSAIRAFAWTRFGRHWGPTSVTYEIELGSHADDGEPHETLSGPKNASWRDMSREVVELSRRDAGFGTKPRVRFVAR
jgi:hypothetical protein